MIDLNNTWCYATRDNEYSIHGPIKEIPSNSCNSSNYWVLINRDGEWTKEFTHISSDSSLKQIKLNSNNEFEYVEEYGMCKCNVGINNTTGCCIKCGKFIDSSPFKKVKASNKDDEKDGSDSLVEIKGKDEVNLHSPTNFGFESKNNFQEHGFTADFEGEIFAKKHDRLHGIIKQDYLTGTSWMSIEWNIDGTLVDEWLDEVVIHDLGARYNLTPIKKEWYEDKSNFPCLVVYDEKEIKLMRSYKETDKHRKEPCLLTADGGIYHSLSKCRPATKEEVLELIVEE